MVDIGEARQAFEAGDWAQARSLLLAVCDEQRTDEMLEMLGAAAWWLDDGSTAIEARERLYKRCRERDDPSGAAHVAIQLAWDATIFRDDAAVARGWARRAGSLLAELPASEDHVWLALREATLDDASPEAFAAARLRARELGALNAEMTAVCLEGRALVSAGRIEEGLARMDEAIAAACADELDDPLAITYACCQLLGVCSRVRDYDRASQWCERIETLCARRNIWSVLSVARCFYAPILISHGRLAEAERVLVAAEAAYRDAVPHHARQALAWLADVRFRQGRVVEARRLLDRAEPVLSRRLVRARLALAEGDSEGASEHAEAFLRQAEVAWDVERAAALELLGRSESRAGRVVAAESALAALEDLAGSIRTAPLTASSLVVRAAIDEALGDLDAARSRLADAADLFERGYAPYDAGCARVELARVLELLGRRVDSVHERRRGEEMLFQLRKKGGSGPLTAREIEVLVLVARGFSNAEVARRLVLSPHTVHRHMANILRKLDAKSRAGAVGRARDLALI